MDHGRTEPDQARHWGDLTGEPLDPEEVAKSWQLKIDYGRQVQVYQKAPIQEAREGGSQVLGVR